MGRNPSNSFEFQHPDTRFAVRRLMLEVLQNDYGSAIGQGESAIPSICMRGCFRADRSRLYRVLGHTCLRLRAASVMRNALVA